MVGFKSDDRGSWCKYRGTRQCRGIWYSRVKSDYDHLIDFLWRWGGPRTCPTMLDIIQASSLAALLSCATSEVVAMRTGIGNCGLDPTICNACDFVSSIDEVRVTVR